MNPTCPKCGSADTATFLKWTLGTHYCSNPSCVPGWFTPPSPNEAEKELVSRHPIPLNKEQQSICNNWAESGQLFENLDCRLFNLPTFARAILSSDKLPAENARLTSKLAEMEGERDDWKREASQHLADTVKLTTGFNEVIDELTASRDSLRQELEKMRG